MIELRQVSKKYGSRLAVEDLSFKVEQGEVVGFLGPNGAGKTTTMNIITGALFPSTGEVWIAGEDIFADPLSAKQKIGYLPEFPPVYTDMYVKDYLFYVARLKRCMESQLKSLVEAAIKKTGLEEVENRLIQNISKGFKQRVGLAQALVSDPKILILDEPTVGLDPNQILEMRNLISQLKGKHTIILSTHILSEVQATCDRVIIIREGRMVTQESLSSLRKKQSQSRRQISIRVKQLTRELVNALNELNGVRNIKELEEKSSLNIFVDTGTGSELNEQIAKVVIGCGAGLIELNESFSLEDVFLQLTKK